MTDRLFKITYALMSEENITCSKLAERFECSVRTIMRDIEKLSLSGVPVYMSRGKGGGVGIMADYILDKEIFSDDEKKQILSSMQALAETGFDNSRETMEKLKSLFGKNETDWLEIEFSKWGEPGKVEFYFNEIKKSILDSKIIKIDYAATDKAPEAREVQPLKLCYRSNSWYLYGWCLLRNDYRFFKLSRILDLRTTDKIFKREKIGRVLVDALRPTKKMLKVRLHVAKEAVYRALDELPVVKKFKDGSVLFEFEADDIHGIINYILSYGPDAQVLEPEEIKASVKNSVEKMLERYKAC